MTVTSDEIYLSLFLLKFGNMNIPPNYEFTSAIDYIWRKHCLLFGKCNFHLTCLFQESVVLFTNYHFSVQSKHDRKWIYNKRVLILLHIRVISTINKLKNYSKNELRYCNFSTRFPLFKLWFRLGVLIYRLMNGTTIWSEY